MYSSGSTVEFHGHILIHPNIHPLGPTYPLHKVDTDNDGFVHLIDFVRMRRRQQVLDPVGWRASFL